MNVLDENILEGQRQILRGWRVSTRQVGLDVGRKGMKDDEIIPLLHGLRRPTFFTRDLGFYEQALCHTRYCLVCLAVGQYEVAGFVRRFLRHPEFGTQAERMGAVVRVSWGGLRLWQLHAVRETTVAWSSGR